jgi:hypothetical protein
MRFIVFLQNTVTGEEFISAQQANTHQQAMQAASNRYPAPRYKVHTAYSQQELATILENLNRWAGSEAPPPLALASASK